MPEPKNPLARSQTRMTEQMQGDIGGLVERRKRVGTPNPLDIAMGFVGGGAGVGAIKRMGGAAPRVIELPGPAGRVGMPRFFKVMDENGDELVKFSTRVKPGATRTAGKTLEFEDILTGTGLFKKIFEGGFSKRLGGEEGMIGAQALGQSAIREVLPQILKLHPGVTRLSGTRVTGARAKSGVETSGRMNIKVSKPTQKKAEAGSRRDQSAGPLDAIIKDLHTRAKEAGKK